MPGQADLDTATNDWITAADKALSAKENARKSYDEELEYGMQPGSFDNWVARNVGILESVMITLEIVNSQSPRLRNSTAPSRNITQKELIFSTF